MNTLTGTLVNHTTGPAPAIRYWLPQQNPLGIGLLIFPGGGYGHLAEHEGAGYAEHFSQAGIACFVVTYRLGTDGHRHPAMLEDALAALSTIRRRAGEFQVDPSKLGVMGSSAGGHLAAHLLVTAHRHASESDVSPRPDFGILCYPVITTRPPHAHAGSIRNLAGDSPSPALLDELCCEEQVTSETPPCFVWHTRDDPGVPVENSLCFAAALHRHHVPYELHVYSRGAHGLGLGASFNWASDALRWIKETSSR